MGVDALSRFPEDINLYHSTLDKETFEAVTDGTTTQQHKNEAWLCAMASSQTLQEQENKVLQQSTQTLKTVKRKTHTLNESKRSLRITSYYTIQIKLRNIQL